MSKSDLQVEDLDEMNIDPTTHGDGGQWDELDRVDEPASQLDPKVQAHLGKLMRAAYKRQLAEPLPVEFMKLLEELDQKERKR